MHQLWCLSSLVLANEPEPAHISWEAWVGILLAAITVVLTALAIFIGIAAVMGYGEIKNEAGRRAQDSIDKKLAEYFGNLDIQARLRAEVQARVSREADEVYRDLSITGLDVAEARAGEQPQSETVGDAYPTEENRGQK